MRPLLKYLLPLLFALNARAQVNLVPNGSFEKKIQCPNSYSNFEGFVEDWFNTAITNDSNPTPDYYNSCANPSLYGVPENIVTNLPAHTGNAYAGIFTAIPNSLSDFLREYIGIKLDQTLIQDSSYNLSFYVSFAQNYASFAVSNIGAIISVDSLSQSVAGEALQHTNSAIVLNNQSGNIINNRGYWTKLSFNFISNGGEKFLFIGNVDSIMNESDTLHTNDDPFDNRSYYLIDDVSITKGFNTGIEENEFQQITLFPNPAANTLTIFAGNLQNAQVELFDISGRQLFQQTLTASQQSIDVSGYANGIYICNITANGKVVKREKVLIVR